MAAPLALAVACAPSDEQPLEGDDFEGESELAGGDHALIRANAGFTWIAPIGSILPISITLPGAAFEARLSPVVLIDQVDGSGNPVRSVATYTGTLATFGERVLRNLGQSFYTVNFDSSKFNLNPQLNYRVRVLPAVGQPALGFADIDVTSNIIEHALALTRSGSFVPLLRGTSLAISFRIATSAVDKDGDGVFDWLDNCPTVRNPAVITPDVPSTGGNQPVNPASPQQPDRDNDGIGDACDCPAGTQGNPGSCVDVTTTISFECLCQGDEWVQTCGTRQNVCGSPTLTIEAPARR